MILWLDRETFSETDLKVVGTYKYAEDARDLLISYAIDDEEPEVWDVANDEPMPEDLRHAMEHAEVVIAHNAQFDKAVHNGIMQAHLPRIALTRWQCSMAWALSHALPGKLEHLGEALGLPEDSQKLKDGKKLIQLFCKPQPANRKVRICTRATHPKEWERFKEYARGDITTMRECVRRMPVRNWDASCIAEWHHDQQINERGFQVDTELTSAGVRAAETEKIRIAQRVAQILGCDIRVSQRDKFMDLLNERYGLSLQDTTADTYLQCLKDPGIHPEAAELMQLAMQANKTSTAKYARLDPAVQSDGRFRGGLQFCGASRTRRLAGRMFQGQNLPSRGLPPADEVEWYIETLKRGSHDLFFNDLMRYGAAALRGVVIAPPGKKLIAADLSNIEGRILAWLAGEHWKLDAFRAYDAGTGPDLYNITAVNIIGGDPWNVPKKLRNAFGKVPDLASGYMGGVPGYQTFAKSYNTRMADHWETIQAQIAPHHVNKAWENFYRWGHEALEGLEISELEWVASETCKLAWRARHPATVKFWYALQDAVKAAINEWGSVHDVGRHIKVKCEDIAGKRWLMIKLPSGRYLMYFNPRVVGTGRDSRIMYMGDASEEGKTGRAWRWVDTHGGKLTGNCCQSTARDVLVPALQQAETEGYATVLSVHDEGVCETPDTPDFTVSRLCNILAQDRPWTVGLPLAAAGFEAYRYKKED